MVVVSYYTNDCAGNAYTVVLSTAVNEIISILPDGDATYNEPDGCLTLLLNEATAPSEVLITKVAVTPALALITFILVVPAIVNVK
jgi:hypothetical protein